MNIRLGKVIATAAFTAVLATAFTSTQAVSAEYYKWTDDDGVVHFSELPPTDRKAQKLKAKVQPPMVEDVPDKVEEGSAESGDATAQDEPSRGISYKDKARCKTERERLNALQSNQRIRLKQPDGSSAYLDKAGILREVNKTKEIIAKVCD